MKCEHINLTLEYPILIEWWTARKCGSPDPSLLPPTGFIVYDDIDPICAGFLYKTDGGIASISHLVASPEAEKYQRDEAMDLLIVALMAHAVSSGYKVVSGAAAGHLKGLEARFKRLGFSKTDSDINLFGRAF